jgi:nitrite reductase/ring-hydroxylating ferredoxin subunit/DMSO/TMAO reductase YedYZ heme-binding membrane subunit
MAVAYQAVQWNRQKRIYDFVLLGGIGAFLLTFVAITKGLFPLITDEILLIRAFGTASFVLLHVILCIGPLCRLTRIFLPLLYNRRHAGVTMAVLALVHAVLVIATYHAGSDINPVLSIFVSDPPRGSPLGIPFQPLGFIALMILLLMAATSHDFWLANLTAPVWKALHMLVYVAYALLVLHVALGALQAERNPFLAVATAAGLVTVLGLHIVAGWSEHRTDRAIGSTMDIESRRCSSPSPSGRGSVATGIPLRRDAAEGSGLTRGFPFAGSEGASVGPRSSPAREDAQRSEEGFVEVCGVDEIQENRARITFLSGERVAIFRYDGKISAVSNVCQHQNGPLGEGRVIDGCITCPWHGYQYVPETGASPPPFTEKVPTFNVRVMHGRVFVHPKPNPAGTRAKPALVRTDSAPSHDEEKCGKRSDVSPRA